jgi:hypothetical protein
MEERLKGSSIEIDIDAEESRPSEDTIPLWSRIGASPGEITQIYSRDTRFGCCRRSSFIIATAGAAVGFLDKCRLSIRYLNHCRCNFSKG